MKTFMKTTVGVLVLGLVLAYNACVMQPALYGTSSTGNPMTTQAAPEILSTVCSVLDRCRADVTMSACRSGVVSTAGVAERLGLPSSTYGNFSDVITAEQSATITANPLSTNQCLTDVNALDCASPEIAGAYDSTAASPFAGVVQMLPAQATSCGGVFAGPVFFSDGFESGDGTKFGDDYGMASYPPTASVPGGCQSGNFCGARAIPAGAVDFRTMWSKSVYYMPDRSYARAYWKFPTNWQFSTQAGDDVWIIEYLAGACSKSGFAVSLASRGGAGNVADLEAFSLETQGIKHTGNAVVADGQWHSIELYTSWTQKNVKVWFDGNLVIDANDLAGNCGAGEVEFGAYVQQVLPKAETFYMDDITLSNQRIGP